MTSSSVRILLVRHGESDGNAHPDNHALNGDWPLSLTETGWKQAEGTGRLFLRDYYQSSATSEWPMIYVSPLLRTQQSLRGILHGMGDVFDGKPEIRQSAFLIEKFFGLTALLKYLSEHPNDKVDPKVISSLIYISREVYRTDPVMSRNMNGESIMDSFQRATHFINEEIYRAIQNKKRDFLIVTHGAKIQAIAANLGNVPIASLQKIGEPPNRPPNNMDVIEITGEPHHWGITKVWDGVDQTRVARDMMAGINTFSVDDLPPVPDFLKRTP